MEYRMIKKAYLRQLKGNSFGVKLPSGHWITLDTTVEFGGQDGAPTPKELLLAALAGCTSMDVVSILKKKRSPVVAYECNVQGDESEGHPRIFKSFHIEYVFYGDKIHPADVQRAIELSQTKYCAVSAQLSASAQITHSYRIEPASKAAEP
jgi:putative redox protein